MLQERSEQRTCVGQTDPKLNEELLEFIHSALREYEEEMYYDVISGEMMTKELVEAARKVEMETLKEHGQGTRSARDGADRGVLGEHRRGPSGGQVGRREQGRQGEPRVQA